MYDDFKELYFFMREEVLSHARCKPLTLSRLKATDEDDQEHCLNWLKVIQDSDTYRQVIRRLKDLPDSRLEFYKMNNMMSLPEVKYRREALKEMRQLWVDTMPELVRRKEREEKETNNKADVS